MFSARLILKNTELRDLWNIHVLYHERLRWFLKLLQRARSGRAGANPDENSFYREFVNFVVASDAKNAKYLFNGVSNDSWITNTADKMTVEIRDEASGEIREVAGASLTGKAVGLLAQGKKLFDKNRLFEGLPRWAGEFILSDAVAFLSGYTALIGNWEQERKSWLKEREAWESINSEYMNVRPQLLVFQEREGNNFSRKRLRWHKYLEFFRENPELAVWRGGSPPVINPIDEAGLENIKKAPKHQKMMKETDAFMRVNPELKALDARHAEYERLFAPRRKNVGNGRYIRTDGFKLRPRFTLPEPSRHPRFLMLNGEQTSPNAYRQFKLPSGKGTGAVELNVVDNGAATWKRFAFRGDQRLAQMTREIVDVVKKQRGAVIDQTAEPEEQAAVSEKAKTVKKTVYSYLDPHLENIFLAELKSARLRFYVDKKGAPKRAYLEFSVKRECRETNEKAKAIKFVPVKDGDRERKQMVLPAGITVACFHLGISSTAYAALATGETGKSPIILDSRKLWLSHQNEETGKWIGEPKIEDIMRHEYELRRKTALRPRNVRGEESDIQLKKHIQKMENDRYKKTARRMIDYALNSENRIHSASGLPLPEADIIVIGDFQGVVAKGENPRHLNRLIRLWKRPQIVALVKDFASEAGMRLYERSSWGGSQTCSRCDDVGKRYLIATGKDKRPPEIKFDRNGRHFACPHCGYRENAEKNAVFNLVNSVFGKGDYQSKLRDFIAVPTAKKVEWHREMEVILVNGDKSILRAVGG